MTEESQELTENEKIKKLQRDNQILKWQNNRLLFYLRSNKKFYKHKVDDQAQIIKNLKNQISDMKTQIINQGQENDDIKN